MTSPPQRRQGGVTDRDPVCTTHKSPWRRKTHNELDGYMCAPQRICFMNQAEHLRQFCKGSPTSGKPELFTDDELLLITQHELPKLTAIREKNLNAALNLRRRSAPADYKKSWLPLAAEEGMKPFKMSPWNRVGTKFHEVMSGDRVNDKKRRGNNKGNTSKSWVPQQSGQRMTGNVPPRGTVMRGGVVAKVVVERTAAVQVPLRAQAEKKGTSQQEASKQNLENPPPSRWKTPIPSQPPPAYATKDEFPSNSKTPQKSSSNQPPSKSAGSQRQSSGGGASQQQSTHAHGSIKISQQSPSKTRPSISGASQRQTSANATTPRPSTLSSRSRSKTAPPTVNGTYVSQATNDSARRRTQSYQIGDQQRTFQEGILSNTGSTVRPSRSHHGPSYQSSQTQEPAQSTSTQISKESSRRAPTHQNQIGNMQRTVLEGQMKR